jgi:hypothetical protein
MGLLGDGSRGSVVDAQAFFDSTVPERVSKLVGMGLLVAIGTTRDRGAISIQCTHDGEWDREYFRNPTDAADWLDAVIKAALAAGLGESEREAPPRQKPTRRRSGLT